jgi:hypothetical protein
MQAQIETWLAWTHIGVGNGAAQAPQVKQVQACEQAQQHAYAGPRIGASLTVNSYVLFTTTMQGPSIAVGLGQGQGRGPPK